MCHKLFYCYTILRYVAIICHTFFLIKKNNNKKFKKCHTYYILYYLFSTRIKSLKSNKWISYFSHMSTELYPTWNCICCRRCYNSGHIIGAMSQDFHINVFTEFAIMKDHHVQIMSDKPCGNAAKQSEIPLLQGIWYNSIL